MTDSEKLRMLADWFDNYDARYANERKDLRHDQDEVQADLRRIADELEQSKDLQEYWKALALAAEPLLELNGTFSMQTDEDKEKILKWREIKKAEPK